MSLAESVLVDEAELCRRLLPVVRLAARRRGVKPDDVDDVTQEVLGRTLIAVREQRVRDPDQIGAFAAGICRNVVADRARIAVRRERLWEAYAPTIQAVVEGDAALASIDRIRLEDCLFELSIRARDVIHRTWFSEATGAEIAAALSTSESNIRVLRHRALEALRDCMLRGAS